MHPIFFNNFWVFSVISYDFLVGKKKVFKNLAIYIKIFSFYKFIIKNKNFKYSFILLTFKYKKKTKVNSKHSKIGKYQKFQK